MNKIYKVIWNRVRHCYVVVSEIAKNHGKEHSTNLRVSKGLCALTLAIGLCLSSYAFAAENTDTSVPFGVKDNGKSVASADYDAQGNLTIGNTGTVAQGDNKAGKNNTTIGTNTDTLRKDAHDETKGQAMAEDNTKLVDGEGQAHPITTSTEAGGSTAIGYQSHAEGTDSTAIGNNAKIINKPVTYYADKDGKKTTSTDDAAWYKDSSGNPTQVPQVFRDADGNTTTTPQYVHTYTEKDPDTGAGTTKTEITSDPSKADQKDGKPVYNYRKSDNLDKLYSVTLYQSVSNSIAAGTNVTANGNNAVAVGYNSTADNSAVAVGDTANASGESSIAAGTKATASGTNATAVGSTSTASGDNTIAIGTGAKATDSSDNKYGSIAIGKGVEANGSSTAVGLNGTKATSGSSAYGNNVVAQNGSSALGSNIQASGGSYASGMGTTDKPVVATGSSYATGMGGTTATNGSMAMGNNVSAGKNGGGAFAVGMGGTTANSGSMAVGNNVKAGENSGGAFAVGMGGTSADGSSMAVGDNVSAKWSSFASGRNGTKAENGGIAYGDNVSAKYGGFAAGTNNTSASSGVAVGSNVHASDGSSYAGGMNGTTANNGSIAFGNNVHAGSSGGGAFAAGMNGTTADDSSVAVGDNVHASSGSYAAGMGGTSASSSAVAIGNNAHAYGNSYVFGSSASADSSSAAIGNSSYATNSSLALGNSAGAYVSGGIALGSNATAYRASGTTGLDPRTGKAYTDTSDKTWNSTYGALSIGNVDSDGTVNGTRQIIGVAAGTNDTDAVNVAQLKAAMTQNGSIHDYSVNSTDTAADTNYSNAGATGKNALAAGVSAKATGDSSVAIGNGALAEGKGATVIGKNAKATGQYATAFGGLETTDKKTGKLVNIVNTASGNSATAFGQGAQARGDASLAFGHNTIAGGADGSGQQSVAFGEDTQALGGRSLAFGEKTVAKYNDSVAFGNDTRASSTGATAFGNRTRALAQYSTAWGNATVAADEESTAWGTDTIAGAKLDDNGAVTNIYTYKNNPDDKDEPLKTATEKMDVHGNLAYIQNGKTASVKQMSIDSGNEKHDYVVLAGKDGNTYVRDYQGSLWKVNVDANGNVTVDTTAGKNGKVFNGKNGAKQSLAKTTVNGAKVDITPDNVLEKAHEGGNGYNIDGYANATAFGYSTEASGDNATAFGNDTKATAAGATAFGYKTLASGENSTAFGENSIAAAKNSLAALGGTVDETAANAASIGKGAEAKLVDSIALGSGSVADRASGAKGYDMLTKGDTTNTSAAWVSNANAIAVGNGSTLTRQITGVAAGSQDTDAVNVAQLKAAGFKVTTQKNGDISSSILNGDTLDFEGKDNAIVSTTKDSKTITVAVSKTPTFDSATFGTTNNEKVTIANGQVSAYNNQQQKRAVVGVDNQGNGTLFLVNDDLSQAHLYTQSSKETGNDGITRMYYTSSTDNGGEVNGIHTIAVLDDGINYAGDNVKPNTSEKVVVKHKLNSTMDITGGADTSNLSDNNIGVVATPAVEDDQGNITQKGKLEIKLNKDLQNLNSVTAGNVRIGNNPANTLKLTENGQETENTAPAGSYATGLDNKAWDTKNPSYVSGRAATEDQLANVSGVVDKGLSFTTNTKDATNTTDNYKGYKVVNRQLGDTISIKAGDADPNKKYVTTNLTTDIANNGDITINMAESPTFNIVTATSLNLSPKDITTKDQKGYTASAQLDAHYRKGSLNPDKNVTMADGSTGMVRLHYHDGEGTIHDLATMDDGQIYAGDIKEDGTLDTTGFGRKMNEKTTINGGVKAKDDLTDNNIGVVSNGTDTLTVKLAKNLQNLESVQAGKTTIDDKGLTIKKSDDDSSKNVVVLGDKVAFGDNQVNNMGSGASKITEDDKGNKTYEYNTLNNGANIGDVKNIANSIVQPVIDTVNKGWELDVNSTKQKAVTPDNPKVNLIQGQNITITGDTTNTDNVTVATADDVRFHTVRVGGVKNGDTYSGGIVIGVQSGKNADGTESANSNDDYYITGLKNTNWDSDKIMKGRAATEDQLKQVATEIKQGSVAGDIYVTGGSVSYNGEGTDTHAKDGKGSINLTRKNGEDVNIDGLHDYYVTGGTVTDDGKKLELTRNDIDGSGNPKKITVDLGNVLKNDLHLVANPAADSNGKYKVDTTTGTVTLKVQNADGTTSNDITIGGFEGLGQGLKFGANKMAKDGGGNPVTNQLGSTINITGAGTKGLTDYSGKNLLTSVEQDAAGNTTVHVLMDKNISADGVTVGQAGKDGVAGADGEVGKAGTIGINGKNGVEGEDGKQGITTTIIRTEKGQAGKDGEIGQQGAPGVDGKDITRIVYQNDQDKVDGKDGSHTVATLDDGLKFSGDDKKVITKKLNEQLQFVGGANKLTQNNIGVVEKDGKLWIQLAETPDLGTKGNLKAGDAQIGWFNGDVLTKTDGTKEKQGSYATGLDNKDWNISNPSYVSGRAATEDQLAKVSVAINNATTAAGKRTVVTVNDKANPAEATPRDGDYGDYDSTNGNLMIAAKKDADGVLTYNIKLNDNLAIGQKGADGQDGKVTVDTKGGTTVVIGHDGQDGENGKDGISVKDKDGKDGVTISVSNGKDGKDGSEGHIGLTGPAGKDGKDVSADIHVKNGQNGVDGTDGNNGKDGMDRIVYEDHNGKLHEVATMDDGLKIGANAATKEKVANPVSNKLNSTINIIGSTAKEKHTYTADNLTTTVEQDADGNTTVKVLMDKDITGNSVTVGRDGQEGSIGIAGKNGIDGEDGKQGITTTIIKTEKGQNGKDGEIGKQGAPGVDGKDITRIVYQNGQDGENGQGGKHVVATLDDGLKFIGDDSTATPVTKKLNDTLQIRGDGTYDEKNNTVDKYGNIQTSVDNGAVKISLSDKINLHQDGSLTVGGDTQDGSTTVQDPIIIKHFDAGKLTVTGTDKDGKTPQSVAGDYVTGLDNKDWNVSNPTYVSGRAATEDQLKAISDTIKSNAETAAGQHTEITVNDKKAPTIVASDKVGTTDYGDYVGGNDNLLIAAKKDPTSNKMTYNIKLNDQLTIGQKGEQGEPGKPSTPGKDGKVTVETKGGTTVVIGHDGQDGDNGKDGLFVTGEDGKDGKSGVSITGPNGADGANGVDGKVGIAGKDGKDAVSISGKDGVGHIGLTGPKGEKGADGTPGKDGISIDITTDLKTATLDDGKNVKTVIKDKDGKETTITQAPRIQYESNGKNYEVATMDDGLKFVGNDGQEVIRKLNTTLSIKGGITDATALKNASAKNLGVRQNADKDGLEIVMTDTPDFTKVTVGGDKKITIGEQPNTDTKNPTNGNYITGLDNTRWDKDHVTENRAATEGQLRDIAGSITNQQQGGGFALTSDEKGADKIVKQDLGKAIQIKGDTTYKADGTVEKAGNIKTSIDNGAIKVELSKDVDLSDKGSIKAGETTINKGGVNTNKVTIKDSTISISKDGINGGGKQITNVQSGGDVDTNAANIGDVKRIAGDMKTEINNNVKDVTNKVNKMGDELTQVQKDVKADRTYQGDDGAAKKVNVKFGSFLSLTGGAKLADLTEEGNIGVVQKEIGDPDHKGEKIAGLSVRLAKHLNLEKTTYTSNENGQTYTSEIDGKGLTIKTGDENRNITVQDGNVNMGGNQIHNVAPGQAPGDAVNVGQLNATNQTVANLGGAVNKLGTRVNRVGAGAAALAALHPLDFDPDDKWDFAAGYGNYKDASAVAVGAYYRPNEDTMFSVGGSFGGGENMVNAGVSFKVGQGNHVSTSRVAMAKEIKDLRQDVANLNAIVNRQSALIDKLTGTNSGTIQDTGNDLFPDVPANHWAYEYVTKLKQAGILTGYPDGNFDGDRMMTRYEFAAIVYRAIMAGAASNPALSQDGTLDKLAKEFSPEMKHIRIDTIAKDKNGKPTIERVRVIPEAKQ